MRCRRRRSVAVFRKVKPEMSVQRFSISLCAGIIAINYISADKKASANTALCSTTIPDRSRPKATGAAGFVSHVSAFFISVMGHNNMQEVSKLNSTQFPDSIVAGPSEIWRPLFRCDRIVPPRLPSSTAPSTKIEDEGHLYFCVRILHVLGNTGFDSQLLHHWLKWI